MTFPVDIISWIINWLFDFYMCTVNSTNALRETISIVKVSGILSNFFFSFRKYYVLWPKFSEITEVTQRMTFETVAFPKPDEFDIFLFILPSSVK